MTSSQYDAMDQQVEDLRERMRLLQQDRRSNVQLLNSNKNANTDEIRLLRDENKSLRSKLTQLQKKLNPDSLENNELSALQRQLHLKRSEYDSLKVASSKHEQQLNKLQDDAKICEMEAKSPNYEDSPLARQIRMLENRLDKAMIKYNEAQTIRNTYEQIVKRLKEERETFHSHLTALERTLRAKKRDYEELLLLSGDANHAREVAQHELNEARSSYDEKRARREGELRERQQVVKVRRQMLEKQMKRDEERTQSFNNKGSYDNSSSDLTHSENLENMEALTEALNDYEKLEEELDAKLNELEESFRKIKDVTGVSNVNEVIDKINLQQHTVESLTVQTKQNQERIYELTKERDRIRDELNSLKYNKDGVTVTRKTADDYEDKLSTSICYLDRSRNKHDRVSNILISVKEGIKHLQDKVEPIRLDIQGKETSKLLHHDRDDNDDEDDNPSMALWSIGNLLTEIIARVRMHDLEIMQYSTNEDYEDDEYEDETELSFVKEDDPEHHSLHKYKLHQHPTGEEQPIPTLPNNQRIPLPRIRENGPEMIKDFRIGTSGGYLVDENDDYGVDIEDDELSRDRVKKSSSQIIRAQERKKAKAASKLTNNSNN